jgi:transcription elongation factor Elf1
LVFIFFGWWTFGIANLVYAVLSYLISSSQPEADDEEELNDEPIRLGKSDSKGYFQKKVDDEVNSEYGGCPTCEERALTKSWIRLEPGEKVKVIECENCERFFDPDSEDELREVDEPDELESTGSAVMEELFG